MKTIRTILTLVCALAMTAASAAEPLSNSEVDARWRKTAIKVAGGGASPNVVTLLKAFHQALPTWVVGEVLDQNDHPAKGTKRNGSTLILASDEEDEMTIIIDPGNGYAEYSALTDVDQMSCCVWRRTNGHRIFAVSLYEQHDPVQHLLCWYDYDPQTQTMKAEQSPIDKYKKPFKDLEIGWSLPRKGTDFVIHEYYLFPDEANVDRVYSWDGMEHHFEKMTIGDFEFQYFGEDEWLKASEQGFTEMDIVDFDNSGHPVLCMKKEDDNWLAFGEFKGKMQTLAVNDEMNLLQGIFHVTPEQDAPWTEKDVVAVTRDFMHNTYYAVFQNGGIGYFVTDTPEEDDEGNVIGYTPKIKGYGAKDESIHIIHASKAGSVKLEPQWRKFEFRKSK